MPKLNLRFIVQQEISGTYTYRVISPTRNNFSAVNIFKREDMWAPITADAVQEIKNREAADKIQQEIAAKRIKEAEARQAEAERQAKVLETGPFRPTEQQKQDQEKLDTDTKFVAVDRSTAESLGINATLDVNAPDATAQYSEPRPRTKEEAARRALKLQGVKIKYDPDIDVGNLSDEALNAAVQAAQEYEKYGVETVLTEGYSTSLIHQGLAHSKGEAIDLRTQNLNLTYQQKVDLANSIQKRLDNGSYRYYVLLEKPNTKDEHIHIEYLGVNETKPTEDPVQSESWFSRLINSMF